MNLMNETPYFSVIIPVYNVQDYLNECIASVIDQKYENWEMILVDDGSTDSSGEICDKWSLMYPQKISVIHTTNQGPLLARDTAMRAAKGKYFLYIDADDIFLEGIFSEMENLISKHGADLIIFDSLKLNIDGTKEQEKSNYEDGTIFEAENKTLFLQDVLTTSVFYSLWKKCVSRELIDFEFDYSMYKNMIQGEDAFVSLVYIDRAKKILYRKKALYGYRMRESSTTHTMSLKNYRNLQTLDTRLSEYAVKWNLTDIYNPGTKRVIYAYSVLHSIAQSKNTKRFKEFYEASEYIEKDDLYRQASISVTKNEVGKYPYILSRFLTRRQTMGAYWFLRILQCLVWIKRKIRG